MLVRMEEHLQNRIKDLHDNLAVLLSEEYWQEDLEVALESLELPPDKIAQIRAHTDQRMWNTLGDPDTPLGADKDKATTPALLTHIFTDAVKQFQTSTYAPEGWILSDEATIGLLRDMQNILRDTVHNYHLILGEEMPGSVNAILTAYDEEILPEIEALLIDTTGGANYADQPHETGEGYDLLTRLDPEQW